MVAQFGDPHRSFELLPDQRLQGVELRSSRDDGREGERRVQVQPSVRLEGGVWFNLNDHVVVRPPGERESIGALQAVDAIDGIWEDSRRLADEIHDRLAP